MQEFLWAIRFLTIIPLGRERELPPERMGRVMVFYPVVGLVIGLCLILIYYPLATGLPLSGVALPPALADAFIIIFYVFLTGAFHVDGLADSMDGLLGGWDRQSRLDIMKDSCIGSFGTIGIVGDMGLRFVFLQNLSDIGLWSPLTASTDISSHIHLRWSGLHKEALQEGIVLLTMVVMGRWAQTLAASISPYAREGGGATPVRGTASGLVANTRPVHCLLASIWPLFLVGIFYGTRGLVMFGVVAAIILLLTFYTKSRIGGVTGDTLGMTNEVAELVFLFLFFVIWGEYCNALLRVDKLMAKILLVLGGARSGKSAFAVDLARGYKRVTYLATARVLDAEMAERVKRHRQIRPKSWQTVESPLHADKRILELEGSTDLVLLDCLTLYVTNLLLDENQKDAKEPYILEEIERLCHVSREASFDIIMVSNEVGLGIIPENPLGRQFMDIAGLVNQQVARAAEAVYFLVAGIAKRMK